MAEGMSPDHRELAQLLVALGRRIEYPPSPDLASGVTRRLRQESASTGATVHRRLLSRRGLAIATLAFLIAVGVAALTPGVRSAVAGWLGVLGIEVKVEEGAPPTPHGDGRLGLGRATTLEHARRAVSFPLASLQVPGFSQPDQVRLGDVPPGGQVSFLYLPRPGLPEAAGTGIGLILSQFRATLDRALIKKVVSTDAAVEAVDLGDGGYWISGGQHFIAYLDEAGRVREETTRLAANTLVWEKGGVTYRLESALAKRQALHLARSLS